MIGRVTVKKGGLPQKSEAVIIPVFQKDFQKNPLVKKADSTGILSNRIKHFEFEAKKGQTLAVENLSPYKAVVLLGLGDNKDFSLVDFRENVAKCLRMIRSGRLTSVDLFLPPIELSFQVGKHIGLALHLTNYGFIKYKGEKEQKKHKIIEQFSLYIPSSAKDSDLKLMEEGVRVADALREGISLTRDLVNEPAMHLGPDEMVQVARSIEKESKGLLKVTVLDESACRKLGMGAYLGVAQGSDKRPKFIVIRTTSKGKKKHLSIVGKTIMFDSGGLSLKPGSAMEDMKLDMAGGAAVLGVFKTFVQAPSYLKQVSDQLELSGVIPACENMPSGKAMKPGDVVRALNGKTIEVLNTDAEGRLVLADALSYAEKHLKADYLLDLATLTGACAVALGNDLAGAFGNDEKFTQTVLDVANHEGEGIWQLPLHKDYLKQMKSDIADLKNIGGGRYGGAITAALFLSEFVDKAKWVHIDIAGPSFRSEPPKGTLPKGASGWGVMTTLAVISKLVRA